MCRKRRNFYHSRLLFRLSTVSAAWVLTAQRTRSVTIIKTNHGEMSQTRMSSRQVCVCDFLFSETELCRQVFITVLHLKIRETPSSGSRAVACRWVNGQTDGWTEMTRLVFDFCNCFANTPKGDETHCTYSITLRRVSRKRIAVEKQ